MKKFLSIAILTLAASAASALTATIKGVTYTYTLSNGKVILCAGTDPMPKGDFTVPAFIDFYPVDCIGSAAFTNATELTSITIPDTVTRIGDFAFYGCERLKTVRFSQALNSIGKESFALCTGLTELAFPPYIQNLGDMAFAQCTSLETVSFTGNAPFLGNAIYLGTPATLTTKVLPASKGWNPEAAGFPARWPTLDDEHNKRPLVIVK